MTADYVAIYSNIRGRQEEFSRATRTLHNMGLSTVFESDRLHILAGQKYETNLLPGEAGIVIGNIFRRHFPSKAFDGTPETSSAILTALREHRLVKEYWGSYIVFGLLDDDGHICVRSPFGSINAYFLEANGLVYFGSDSTTLLRLAGRQRSIDWGAVARHVIWDDFSHERTCLEAVGELASALVV